LESSRSDLPSAEGERLVEFRILGPFEVVEGERMLDVGGPKQRAVLALLVVEVGKVVSLDRLIDQLWGDQAPARATGTLQAYISNLRRALEPDRPPRAPAQVLATRPPGYVLQVPHDRVDAIRFEESLRRGRQLLVDGHAAGARAELEAALGLWRGSALADLAYEPFARPEIERLDELRAAALEARIEADLILGRHGAVTTELERMVTEQPLRERVWELLMVALYRSGRQADALRAYQKARSTLLEELGLEPGPGLRRLERDVLDQASALEWHPSPRAAGAVSSAPRWPTHRGPEPLSGPGDSEATGLLVGREALIASLERSLERAMAGGPHLVVVAGEAGVGKTRLVAAVADVAARRGIEVAWGRCSELSGAPAFWPWAQVVGAVLARRGSQEVDELVGDGRDDLAQIVPTLSEGEDGLDAPADDPDTARFRLFDSTTAFLARASAGGLVVALDDVQWADPASLRLLHFVVTDGRPRALLVVATCRDLEVARGGVVDEALTALLGAPTAERLDVRGLDRDAVAEFVEHAAEGTVPEAVVDSIHRRTAGNPLFVGQLVRLMASEGRLHDVPAPRASPLPAELKAVIRRRIERLPGDAETILTLAAVIGEEFGLDAVERAAEIGPDRLLDLLEVALVTGVVVATDTPGRYRFSHGVVRETLYDGLSTVQRARLHARLGRVLEALWHPDLEPHVAELAFHFCQGAVAGTAEHAFAYAVRAARMASTHLAYEQAAEHWRQALVALDLWRPGDRDTRYEVLMGLGQALRCGGDITASRAAFEEAIAVVTRMDDAERMARAAVSIGSGSTVWSWRGYGTVDHAAIDVLERALRAIGPADSPLRCEVLSTLAVELYYADQRDRSDVLSREALAMAGRLGDPKLEASALNMHYISSLGPDRPENRLAIAERLVALPTAGAPEETGLVGRLFRMVSWLELGDVESADADLDVVIGMTGALRQPALIAQVAWYRAMRALLSGRLEEGEALMNEAFAIHQRTTLWGAFECLSTQLFTLRRDQGRILELEPILGDLANTSEFRGFREAAALMYLDAGRPDDARRVLGDADAFAPMPRDWSWLFLTCLQAEVCAEIGRPADAERLADDLAPYGDLLAVIGTGICCWGPVAYFRGRLAAALGRTGEAVELFRIAADHSVRIGAPTWQARAADRLIELRTPR
jgi:DNA-binding SARP family transcriptional activator